MHKYRVNSFPLKLLLYMEFSFLSQSGFLFFIYVKSVWAILPVMRSLRSTNHLELVCDVVDLHNSADSHTFFCIWLKGYGIKCRRSSINDAYFFKYSLSIINSKNELSSVSVDGSLSADLCPFKSLSSSQPGAAKK